MVRLAVGQMNPRIGDYHGNLTGLRDILKTATDEQIDVLVLPELANSGYAFDTNDEAESLAIVANTGEFCTTLREWSADNGLVVSGFCEKSGDTLHNSVIVYGEGRHLSTYRKLHLFDKETRWFSSGDKEPPVIDYRNNRYGVMLCFDWVFPEVTRVLALKGAQVILHPANLVLPYCQSAMITRSIENRIFTATANRVGKERGLSFSGMSQITDPKGNVLIRSDETSVGVSVSEIDPSSADDKMITERNNVLRDRRPEFYRRLCDDARS